MSGRHQLPISGIVYRNCLKCIISEVFQLMWHSAPSCHVHCSSCPNSVYAKCCQPLHYGELGLMTLAFLVLPCTLQEMWQHLHSIRTSILFLLSFDNNYLHRLGHTPQAATLNWEPASYILAYYLEQAFVREESTQFERRHCCGLGTVYFWGPQGPGWGAGTFKK